MPDTHITLGLRCNNRCVFCAQRDADPDTLPEPRVPGPAVALAGGEPTLYELVEYAKRLRDNGAQRVLVQTNGRRLAYKRYAAELEAAGVTHLDVSLHGPTPVIHDYHTGIEGSFLQTAKGIQTAAATSISVGVTTVVTRSNFRHLPAIATLVGKLRADAWLVSAAEALGAAKADADAILPRLGMLDEFLTEAGRRATKHGVRMVTRRIPACVTSGSTPAREYYAEPAHQLPSVCDTCVVAPSCGGPPVGYPERYAERDLQPISDVRRLAEHRQRADAPWFAGIGFVA